MEMLVNAIISQHYLKKVVDAFLLEVLYDEYFNFGLKINILEKILEKINKFDNKKIQNLRRLNNIRNHFAHRNQQFIDLNSGEERVPDPKRPNVGLDLEFLHDEFVSKEKEVVLFLKEIFERLGGVLSEKMPKKNEKSA
jgi:hypothetical protein